MSKKREESYKKYLYRNFLELSKCLDHKLNSDTDLNWKKELIAYNNIIGSLIGLIDGKGKSKELDDCKKLVLNYYEFSYPEKQLDCIDTALYSKDCYEYINFAVENLITDNRDLEIIKEFSAAYLKGYNLSKDVSLRSSLPYYVKKSLEYSYKLDDLNKGKKLYQL